MASFLKRLFGGADKAPVTVASESPPVVAAPSPVATTDRTPATESLADLFAQKQSEFESSEAATVLREEPQPVASADSAPDIAAKPTSENTVAEFLKHKMAEDCAEDQTAGRGGIYINSGTLTVGGDIVGGNKYGGFSNAAAIEAALEPLEKDIESSLPADLKLGALRQLYTIGEWAKRYEPDLVAVGKALKWLIANAPQLTAKLRSTLTNSVFPRSIREMAIVLLPEETVEFSETSAAFN